MKKLYRIHLRYILGKYLLANTFTTEQEIMHEMYSMLKSICRNGYMIDVPVRERWKNRHPEVVEELQYYVSIHVLKVTQHSWEHIEFELKNTSIIEGMIKEYEKEYPTLKETYENIQAADTIS